MMFPSHQGKSLSNEQLTPLLAIASENIIKLLQEELKTLKRRSQQSNFNAANMINFILHNAQGQPITSIHELNERYKQVSFNQRKEPLIYNPQQYSQTAQKKLLDALTVHLSAIAAGFQAGSFDYSQQSRREQTRIVQRVYYVGGYRHYDYYQDTFWRDMFFIHMLNDWSWRSHHHAGPSVPYSRRSDQSCDEDAIKALVIIVVVFLLLALASISSYYLYFELGKTLDQVTHFENLITNSLKLSALGGGGFGGFLLGLGLAAALGASGPALPIIIGICMALICGAASIALANIALTKVNESINRHSAIRQDARFKLSTYEKYRLRWQGFDVNEVNEAIRELASCYARTNDKMLGFNDDRTKLIKQLRMLKSGAIQSDYFCFNHKAFHVRPEAMNEPPPAYQSQQTQGLEKQSPQDMPPAYNPAWSLFRPEPPSYEESCQTYSGPAPSAPPMQMLKS